MSLAPGKVGRTVGIICRSSLVLLGVLSVARAADDPKDGTADKQGISVPAATVPINPLE
jgi:hypothetical protein